MGILDNIWGGTRPQRLRFGRRLIEGENVNTIKPIISAAKVIKTNMSRRRKRRQPGSRRNQENHAIDVDQMTNAIQRNCTLTSVLS